MSQLLGEELTMVMRLMGTTKVADINRVISNNIAVHPAQSCATI